MDMYGNIGSHPGTRLGVRIADPNTRRHFNALDLTFYAHCDWGNKQCCDEDEEDGEVMIMMNLIAE